MRADPFLQGLERVVDGEIQASEVLEPYIEGLRNLLGDFEESLEHQPEELIDCLEPHLDAAADGVQVCLDLARQILEDEVTEEDDEETVWALADAHNQLNDILLDFHQASWLFRGPTSTAWVNMAVKSAEDFLGGGDMDPGLAPMLDQQVQQLRTNLRLHPSAEGEALVRAASKVADWGRGVLSATREELEDMLTILIGTAERAQDLVGEQSFSLEQLIQALQEESTTEELLFLLECGVIEVRQLIERVEVACLSSSPTTSEAADEALECLEHLEQTMLEIAEVAHQVDEVDLAEPLIELYEELEKRLERLQAAGAAEGTALCPFCGERNARQTRRCGSCSRQLAAVAGEETSQLNLTEGEQGSAGPEEENVRRLRIACQQFQEGNIELAEFQGHVSALHKLLDRACKGMDEESDSITPSGLAFLGAAGELADALEHLARVELSADKTIEDSLAKFMSGVEKMRAAQKQSVAKA